MKKPESRCSKSLATIVQRTMRGNMSGTSPQNLASRISKPSLHVVKASHSDVGGTENSKSTEGSLWSTVLFVLSRLCKD